MNFDAWKIALEVAALLLALGSFAYTRFATRARVTSHQIDDVKKDVQDQKDEHSASIGKVKDRVAALESDIKHMPDKESVHRIELATAEMRGDISTMAETFKTIGRTVRRLEEFLIEKAK